MTSHVTKMCINSYITITCVMPYIPSRCSPHLVSLNPRLLRPQAGLYVSFGHPGNQSLHAFPAQPHAGLFRRIEKHQPEPVATPFTAQLPVDAKQKLEHGAAAHG